MKLELTDKEIKQAVAAYVSGSIGIDLVNNDLAITFSATRHEGLIAKLETTPKSSVPSLPQAAAAAPVVVPGYSDGTEPVADPAEPAVAAAAQAEATLGDPLQEAATLVPVPAEPVGAEASTVPVADATKGDIAQPEQDVAEVKPAEVKPKATATLFGKPATA